MKHEYTYFRLGCPCFCVRFGGCSRNVLSCPVLFSILFPRVIIYYNVSVRFPFPAFCNVSVCVTSCFPEFACACHKENFKKVPRSFCVSEKVCTFASAFGSDPSADKRSLRKCERTRKRIGKAQYMSVRRWGRVGCGPESEQRKKKNIIQ